MSNRRLRPRQYLFQREVRAKAPSFLANIARIANATNATNATNGTNGTNGTNIIKVTPPPAWNSSRTVKTTLPQRRLNFQRLFMVLNWTMSKIKKYKILGRWAWFALILYISNHQHTFIIHSSIFFTSAQACLGVDPTILAALCAEKPSTPKWGTICAVSERVKRQRLMWMMWKATEASWISTLPQSMNWWSQIISGGQWLPDLFAIVRNLRLFYVSSARHAKKDGQETGLWDVLWWGLCGVDLRSAGSLPRQVRKKLQMFFTVGRFRRLLCLALRKGHLLSRWGGRCRSLQHHRSHWKRPPHSWSGCLQHQPQSLGGQGCAKAWRACAGPHGRHTGKGQRFVREDDEASWHQVPHGQDSKDEIEARVHGGGWPGCDGRLSRL